MPTEPKTELEMLDTERARRKLEVVDAPDTEPSDSFVLEGDGYAPTPGAVDREHLTQSLLDQLRTVRDPEIPLDIVALGLVYSLDVSDDGDVHVRMSLTAPGCPVADDLVQQVHDRLLSTRGVSHAKTELVWDPPWTMDRMDEAAKLALGLF
jgi:FeS assembly SUF system protein